MGAGRMMFHRLGQWTCQCLTRSLGREVWMVFADRRSHYFHQRNLPSPSSYTLREEIQFEIIAIKNIIIQNVNYWTPFSRYLLYSHFLRSHLLSLRIVLPLLFRSLLWLSVDLYQHVRHIISIHSFAQTIHSYTTQTWNVVEEDRSTGRREI